MLAPYHKETETLKQLNKQPENLLRKAASVAPVVAGSALANKVIPFLNQMIPYDLMKKGLSKISPVLKDFVDISEKNGYQEDEVRGFLQEKFAPAVKQEEKSENPLMVQARNFENQYPEISSALGQYINNGQTPEAAAAILKNSSWAKDKIKKIEKDSGMNFVDFITKLMGSKNQTVTPPQPNQQMQQPQSGQQQGSGNQMLAQMFEKIMSL